MGKRSSKIWDLSKLEFEKIVMESNSYSDILRKIGLSTGCGNWKILKKRLNSEQIDYSHIPNGSNSNKGRKFPSTTVPLNNMLTENSRYSRGNLKRRLIQEGILRNVCSICGIEPFWQGKDMTLVIDHINGINNDNRLENLRLVCPNCNSQLPTTNRNHKNKRIFICLDCGKPISKWGKRCRKCSFKHIIRPEKNHASKEELEELIKTTPMTKIGEMFGVSDNAVKKWCKKYGIQISNRRGFWSKQKHSNV